MPVEYTLLHPLQILSVIATGLAGYKAVKTEDIESSALFLVLVAIMAITIFYPGQISQVEIMKVEGGYIR